MKKSLIFILTIIPFITLAQNPGGVSGEVLWLKADAGVTESTGTLTGWLDQTATNTFTVVGTPGYFGDTINFNPAISFSNSDLPASLPSNRLDGDASISVVEAYAVYTDDANNTHGSLMSSTIAGASYPRGFFLGSDNQFVTVADGAEQNTYPYAEGGQFQIANIDVSTSVSPFSSARINGNTTAFTVGTGDFSSVLITPMIGGVTNAAGSSYTHFNGQLAELFFYSSALTAADRQNIESYLALKYSLTLDAAIGNYISSVDSVIWDATDATYHNDVIGIARDDNSGLLQRQSTTNDDSTQIYLSTLAANNSTNAGSFSSDEQFVIIGHNGAELKSSGSLEYPAGQGIRRRIEREWKVINTGFNGTFSMDVQLSANDTNFAADLIFLVDYDGDFSDATVGSPTFSITDGNVSITGISTADIPTDTTLYVTIASNNIRSALPIELVRFEVQNIENEEVSINWITASEKSNRKFTIEKSKDAKNWFYINSVEGQGNSDVIHNYSFTDKEPFDGINYYRLKQVDNDGVFSFSPIRSVNVTSTNNFKLLPNPARNQIFIEGDYNYEPIRLFDIQGTELNKKVHLNSGFENSLQLDISTLQSGMYILTIGSSRLSFIKK